MNVKPRESIALELLAFKMEARLAEGKEALPLEDVNEVLFIGNKSVIDPKTNKELEII